MNKKINTRRLVESGILIALALILSKIKIINLPWGGGISLFGMMPMILLSYRHGLKWGLFSSFVYGAVKITFAFVDNSFAALSFGSLALMLVIDYVLAYTCMGL
ncbi:MAG: energy-coupled thiamine transporter ThiT, partial [Oscillospiraceae bacterium]